MVTYRFLQASIIKTLKENFDDASITPNQVLLWLQFYANRIKAQHIKKTDTSGAFVTIIENIAVEQDVLSKFVTLPKTIFDLDWDGGVEALYYIPENCANQPIPFSRVKMGEAWRVYLSKLERPEPANPIFYRAHKKLRLLGVENVNIANLILGVYDTIDFFNDLKDLDAEVDIGEEHMDIVMRGVIELAQFGQLVKPDLANEGADVSAELNQPARGRQQQQSQQPNQ